MVFTADPHGSSTGYMSSPTQYQGLLTCPNIFVPVTAEYRVWTYVYGQDSGHDSFFIDVDGDAVAGNANCMTDGDSTCTHIFDISDSQSPCTDPGDGNFCLISRLPDAQLNWNPLNDRTVTCGLCAGNFTERRLTLTAGVPHTIKFRQRDPGARLYYVILTTSLTYDPNVTVPTPTAAPLPPTTGWDHHHRCYWPSLHYSREIYHRHTGPRNHSHPPYCGGAY